jgi:hypothetical protein
VTLGFGIFDLRSVRDDKHIVKQGDANLGTAVVVKSDADTVDRSNMEEELDKSVDSTITNYYGKKERKTPLILRALFGLTVGVISGIISLIYLMLRPLFIIINPSTLYEKANGNYYRKAKMFEEFADSFVASYGLGPSLTSGLAKLTKDAGVVDLKTLSFLNYVPILNLYLAWSSSWAEADLSLRHGYATSSNRLATGYQTLDYELGHNKDLSDGDKKDIKAQMDEMAKTYDEYIKRPGAKNFTFKLIHQIVNKKIDDEKTDIKENILDILQAHKDEIEKLPSIDPDLQGDITEAKKKSMRQFSQDALAALKMAKVEQ